jgi:hypothetical protein
VGGRAGTRLRRVGHEGYVRGVPAWRYDELAEGQAVYRREPARRVALLMVAGVGLDLAVVASAPASPGSEGADGRTYLHACAQVRQRDAWPKDEE